MKVSEFRYRQRTKKRPAGRGTWRFMIRGEVFEVADSMYSAAKKEAIKVAKERESRGIRLIAPTYEELAAEALAAELEATVAA